MNRTSGLLIAYDLIAMVHKNENGAVLNKHRAVPKAF